LPVQIPHGSGPAARQPLIELVSMRRRTQVGDAAGDEAEALRLRLDSGGFEGASAR
jgi:hypothetical protein